MTDHLTREQVTELLDHEEIERLAERLEAAAMNCIEGAECAETRESAEKSFVRSVAFEKAATNLRTLASNLKNNEGE